MTNFIVPTVTGDAWNFKGANFRGRRKQVDLFMDIPRSLPENE